MKKPVRIWVVEDNEMYCQAIVDSFQEHKRIELESVFGSGEELIEKIEKEKPPQVILMDIGLPGMSGIDGVKKVKANHPEVEIIMFTVYQDNERIFQALCSGASGYLLKNSSTEEIEKAIFDTIDGAAPINPQIAKKVLGMFFSYRPPENSYDLTTREREILELLVEGFSKKKISAHLYVSYHTVDTHIKNIYTKLQVNSGNEAVAKALREGLI